MQSNTVFKPGESDAAVMRLREQNEKNKTKYFLVLLLQLIAIADGLLSIPRGAIAAVAESARNVSC